MPRLRSLKIPRIPDQDGVSNAATSELNRMWAEIEDLWLRLWKGESVEDDSRKILVQIKELAGDARAAGRVSGLISPWSDDLEAAISLSLPVALPTTGDQGPVRFSSDDKPVDSLDGQ